MPRIAKARSVNKRKNDSRQIGVFNDPPMPSYVKIIIAVIIAAVLVWFFVLRGASRYSEDPGEVRGRMQSVLNAANEGQKQPTSNIIDEGCNSNASVGLGLRISCSMRGYGYFKVTGDTKTALAKVDTELHSLGYAYSLNTEEAVSDNNRILSGVRQGDVPYTNKYTSVTLGWSELLGGLSSPASSAVSEVLSLPGVKPAGKVTIIAITVQETYWLCSAGNSDLFGISCMFPPHALDR